MKNVSLAKVIEKNRLASDQAWLIALNIDVINSDGNHVEYLRVVRNDEQITIDGDVFEPFPFDIDVEESTDGVPTLNLTISDSSQIVQSYMQNYSGGIGFEIGQTFRFGCCRKCLVRCSQRNYQRHSRCERGQAQTIEHDLCEWRD